jgi:hypothetical protein
MDKEYKIENDFVFQSEEQKREFQNIIKDKNFSNEQKREIFMGLVRKVDVSIYAREDISPNTMMEIRFTLAKLNEK